MRVGGELGEGALLLVCAKRGSFDDVDKFPTSTVSLKDTGRVGGHDTTRYDTARE